VLAVAKLLVVVATPWGSLYDALVLKVPNCVVRLTGAGPANVRLTVFDWIVVWLSWVCCLCCCLVAFTRLSPCRVSAGMEGGSWMVTHVVTLGDFFWSWYCRPLSEKGASRKVSVLWLWGVMSHSSVVLVRRVLNFSSGWAAFSVSPNWSSLRGRIQVGRSFLGRGGVPLGCLCLVLLG
jgi:hypothetical protein